MISNNDHVYFQKKQKHYAYALMAVVASLIVVLLSIARWEYNRSLAICVPEEPTTFPLIPYLPALNIENDDAKLFTFVEKYLKNVYSESITDYHRPTNLSRYDTAYLKLPLQQAIYMSEEEARVQNKLQFANSDRIIEELRRCNCGWVFNIHAIESVNRIKANGHTYVTAIGEFQATFDQVKVMLPHRLEGLYRIHLVVKQLPARRGDNNEFTNEYGLFVVHQEKERIPYDQRQKVLNEAFNRGFFVP